MENSPQRKPKINNRIRYCRAAINLSQKEAAFRMGVPPPQFSRWEQGEVDPGVYNAIGLAVATGRLVEDIFLEYRQEWQGKIKGRTKPLNPEENGKEE